MVNKRITAATTQVHQALTVEQNTPLVKCAQLMHDANVGSLVVTGRRNGQSVPVGLLTDRDITIKVVAFLLDPGVITAGDIMAHFPPAQGA